ncbi:MAG: peroxide stress protein YaaA [Cyclobacteriaceae bacterium]|nr:peroxide stress protein YaaA [Cyclobacteriaceae bacterium]MCH8516054.1 peroxide stress protein YaaA [Cyclobacteriaceae bacterium]
MLVLLSPSKGQNFDPSSKNIEPTEVRLIERSKKLLAELKEKSTGDIKSLMDLSDDLAELNYNRFQNMSFPFDEKNAKPAVLAFKGDVYGGLDAESLSEEQLLLAQKRIRILSGFYGLIRPLDLIQPYRLEMKTKLANPNGKDLYQFWGDELVSLLNSDLEEQDNKVVINLASNEYFKAIPNKKINGQLITPIFKEQKGDQLKVVAIYAKKARGMMARFIIENDIEKAEDIKSFDREGYSFVASASTDTDWVFAR